MLSRHKFCITFPEDVKLLPIKRNTLFTSVKYKNVNKICPKVHGNSWAKELHLCSQSHLVQLYQKKCNSYLAENRAHINEAILHWIMEKKRLLNREEIPKDKKTIHQEKNFNTGFHNTQKSATYFSEILVLFRYEADCLSLSNHILSHGQRQKLVTYW